MTSDAAAELDARSAGGTPAPEDDIALASLLPFVTVAMPVRNESGFIHRSLGAVLAQDYPPDRYEIILADGLSTDDTRELALACAAGRNVRIVDNPARIAPTGMNAAIRAARGEIIVRVDGHCEIASDYVRTCVELLSTRECAGVGGPVETVGNTWVARAIAAAVSSPFGVGGNSFRTVKDREIWAGTIPFPAYPRTLFEQVGLFDEEMIRSQDAEFNARVREYGGRLLLSPAVRSTYYSRGTLRKLARQYYQYGYWKVRVLQKHPRQMAFRQLIAAGFVAWLAALAVASTFSQTARWALAGTIALYAAASIAASLVTASRNRWLDLPLLPLIFAILHITWGAGFLHGLW
ncbi:MAG: glycosyltransferase family 2 protein, partial [Planctomycetia bacterium]|nr:glycosyltransferase family 2 protein [Planctomycetia bacterium]